MTALFAPLMTVNAAENKILPQAGGFSAAVFQPATPTLVAPAQNATGIPAYPVLTWTASAGATAYRVQLSVSAFFTTMLVNDSSVTATSLKVGPLANNTVYYWRVDARNSAGISPCSSGGKFTTGATGTLPGESVLQRLNLRNGTSLNFGLSRETRVVVRIYSTEGRLVSQLLDETRGAGNYNLPVARNPHGTYFLDFQAGDDRTSMKITL